MLSIEEAKIRVARGAAHLDTVRPQWFTQIDVGTLTLHDPCRCVVGQLCGLQALGWAAAGEPFLNGARRLFGSVAQSESCGCLLEQRYEGEDEAVDYASLQDAWIAAIADRRLAQGDNKISDPPEDVRVGQPQELPGLALRA